MAEETIVKSENTDQAQPEVVQAEVKAKSVFETLNAINVNNHVEKKKSGEKNPDGSEKYLTYLSWVWAWGQVKQLYPDASYEVRHWGDKPYLNDDQLGIMVETSVTISGETITMWLPVMNSSNKGMKATPYSYKTKYGEKEVEAATMFDINKAIMRCLAKNLAMFGLGLYIYAGEDLPEEEAAQAKNELQAKIDEACAKMRAVTSRKELEEVWREYSKTVPVEQGSAFMNALQEMAQQFPKPQ